MTFKSPVLTALYEPCSTSRPFLRSLLGYLMDPEQPAILQRTSARLVELGDQSLDSQSENINSQESAVEAQWIRPYESMVWSSARKENVWGMLGNAIGTYAQNWIDSLVPPVNSKARNMATDGVIPVGAQIFEENKHPLAHRTSAAQNPAEFTAVWCRDQLRLPFAAFGRKSRTTKNMDWVAEEFSSRAREHYAMPRPYTRFQSQNMILLDDSVSADETKAGAQPYNHLSVPTWDENLARLEYRSKKEANEQGVEHSDDVLIKAARRRTYDDSVADVGHDYIGRKTLLESVFGDALAFYDKHIEPASQTEATLFRPNRDCALIAAVGILDEIKDVKCLATWIAAGGLTPNVDATFTREDALHGWDSVVARDLGLVAMESTGERDLADPVLMKRHFGRMPETQGAKPVPHEAPAHTPSHPEYLHWHQSPKHFLYWLRRGMAALDDRGVGLDPEPPQKATLPNDPHFDAARIKYWYPPSRERPAFDRNSSRRPPRPDERGRRSASPDRMRNNDYRPYPRPRSSTRNDGAGAASRWESDLVDWGRRHRHGREAGHARDYQE